MNRVVLMGGLVNKPEIRMSSTGTPVARFRLAVNRYNRDGKDTADFISITAFGKKAQFCENYLDKGRQICLEGSIKTGSYENNEGTRIFTTEVWAEQIEFADSPRVQRQEEPDEPMDDFEAIDDDTPF